MSNIDNETLPKCPVCKTKMKSTHAIYSKKLASYYVTEYNCESCGMACTVDEHGIIEYVDRNGKKLYGGK